MTVSREGASADTLIILLSSRCGIMEAVRVWQRARPTMILFRIPVSFRGPELTDVSSVSQTMFLKISIAFTDECLSISNKQAFDKECVQSSQIWQWVTEPINTVDVWSVIGLVVAVNAFDTAGSLELKAESDNAARSCSKLEGTQH